MPGSSTKVTAVILAGGRATRANGKNKGLLLLHKKPLIEHILEKIGKQVRDVIINTNSNLSDYQRYNFPVIEDNDPQFLGPLSGLKSVAPYIQTPYLITLPCDTPFIPTNFVSKMFLQLEKEQKKLAVVNNGRQQNLFMLLHRDQLNSVDEYLSSGKRSVYGWIEQHDTTQVDFTDQADSFRNINTLEALNTAHEKI